jgi:lysophospholipase L1-like esterase
MDAVPGSIKRLTFSGKSGIVVPAGAPVYSDPTNLSVHSGSDLIVSVSVKNPVALSPFGGATMMLVDGDAVLEEKLSNPRKVVGRPIATSVLVASERPINLIVALGDSISDGVRDKPSAPHGWVSAIAAQLASDQKYKTTAIVTAGIGGNRVLRSGWGPSALARADRDIFSLPGVHSVILLEGINDIGFSESSKTGTDGLELDAKDLIAGYQQLATRAHAHGLKILIGTLIPFQGSWYYDADKEQLREAVNAWIRTSKEFDGVIDFDQALRDPEQPKQLNSAFDSGDHLHPNEVGYKAMADAIDLSKIR